MSIVKGKPNHICVICGKAYYACNHCDKNTYRVVACSPKCYAVYKSNDKIARVLHTRTDMTDEEFREMMKLSSEALKKMSEEELSEYSKEIEEIGLDGVVDLINRMMDGDR